MNKVRIFLMKYHNLFCGLAAAGLLVLCVALTASVCSIGTLLLSLVLLLCSLWCVAGESWQKNVAGYFLLGIAIYCFPATAIIIPFVAGYWFRQSYGVWKACFILIGILLSGLPDILTSGNILAPFYRLFSWLNRDNLFDHNICFWSLVTGREQLRFSLVSVLLTIGILFAGSLLYQSGKVEREDYLIWSSWTCLLFLPYGHAEDGIVLVILLLTCRKLWKSRLYQAVLLMFLMELLLMLGSAYGGYERLGYDFYQMAVGVNVMAWLLFSYRGFSKIWNND